MKRGIFIGALLFFSVVAFAQTNSIDKSTITNIENNVIEITAVAIPREQINYIDIDPENYHKAITIGNSIEKPGQAVEVSTTAIKYNDRILSSVKKEVLQSGDTVVRDNINGNYRTVEKSAGAARRK